MRLFKLYRRKSPRSSLPTLSTISSSPPTFPPPPPLSSSESTTTEERSPSFEDTRLNSFSFAPKSDADRTQMYSIREHVLDDVDDSDWHRNSMAPPTALSTASPRNLSTSSVGAPTSRPQSSRGEQLQQRPKSAGQFNHRRPTLADILADRAPHPWTLSAFTQYAAQNLCDETIEFIGEASKYDDLYDSLTQTHSEEFDPEATKQLKSAFREIIMTYIVPSSPREVNIPGDIRIALVSLHKTGEVQRPEALQPAVIKVKELIEDSILFSFLNETRPPSESSPSPSPSNSSSHLRDRATASRISQNHGKRFSTSILEPAISFSTSTFRGKKHGGHGSSIDREYNQGLGPTSAPNHTLNGIATYPSRYSHHTESKSGNNSVSSMSGTNPVAGFLDPALTDDYSGGLRSPLGSESFLKSPPSEPALTPPETPDFGAAMQRNTSATTRQQYASWRKMGARLTSGLGVTSLRKRRSESAGDGSSGDDMPTNSSFRHKNSAGSDILLEVDER